jgi:protein SCO1
MRVYIVSAAVLLAILTGCRAGSTPEQPMAQDAQTKVYHLRGKVIAADPATGQVTLQHEAIAGYMDAMTMPYKLKDPGILSELHPGDELTADLLVQQGGDGDVALDHIVVIAQAKPDYRPTVLYHVPEPGDQVPDFTLRNQDGRTIHLNQFRGKTVLVTFIYTRCPQPNFCPLITRNFAAINRELEADPGLYAKTHLVCVSFDPDNDTPARLRAYGATYIGGDTTTRKAGDAFAHWDFAAPDKPELKKMALYFDVGVTSGPDDTITHTLSTTLIGPHGKVAQFYPGNEWTPDQVMNDVKRVVANAG